MRLVRTRRLTIPLAALLAFTVAGGVFFAVRRSGEDPGSGTIKAVATYPLGARAVALAQVDGEGRMTICHRGTPALALGDVTPTTAYFADADIKSISIPCRPGTQPRTLIRAQDVPGSVPSTNRGGVIQTLDRPIEAPDGKRIAFERRECGPGPSGGACNSSIYVADLPAGPPRRIGFGSFLRWADSRHVVAATGLWDPVAIDVDSKAIGFFSSPRAWFGKPTPDGRRAFLDLRPPKNVNHLYPEGVFVLDRSTGLEQEADLEAGALAGSPDRTGERFVELTGESTAAASGSLRLYDARGRLATGFASPIPRSDACDPNVGWFDEARVWLFDACGGALVDAASGRATKLVIPELNVAGLDEAETTFVSIYERAGAPATEASIKPAVTTNAIPGLSMTLPPSWRTQSCRCGPPSYPAATLVAGRAPILVFKGIGHEMTVVVTSDTAATALRKLRNDYARGRPSPGRRGDGISTVTTRTQRLGILTMTVLELRSGTSDLLDTILVGRRGNRTFVVTLYAEGRSDPSAKHVLDSIRFP